MVTDWIREVQALGREGEGIEPGALAKVHARFEQIHPFPDGNQIASTYPGRDGRRPSGRAPTRNGGSTAVRRFARGPREAA